MLLSFEVQNFKSILETSLNLESREKRHPAGYKDSEYIDFFESGIKEHKYIVPINAIFGANASGKTNLLKALQKFQKCFLKGISRNYRPNKLNSKFNSTKFKIKFIDAKSVYSYELEYNEKEILKEILIKNESVILNIENNVFQTSNLKSDNVNLSSLFIESCFDDVEGETEKKFVFPFASKLRSLLSNLNEDINIFYSNVEKLKIFTANNFPYSLGIDLLGKLSNNEDGFREIAAQLQKIDIDIEQIRLKPESLLLNGGTLVMDDIETYHKDVQANLVKFKMKEESLGTRILFGLIGMILFVLKKGEVLLVDELDRSLHFMAVNRILHWFKSKDLNRNNAQLIFTAHDTDILEDHLVRASEISIVEKHLQTGSVVMKNEMRNVINFRLQYVNGCIGGLPNA